MSDLISTILPWLSVILSIVSVISAFAVIFKHYKSKNMWKTDARDVPHIRVSLEEFSHALRADVIHGNFEVDSQTELVYRDFEGNSSAQIVGVFFGTDRKYEIVSGFMENSKTEYKPGFIQEGFSIRTLNFTDKRNKTLTLGGAVISVPTELHKFGTVERPRHYSVFGVTLYREPEDHRKHFIRQNIAVLPEDIFRNAISEQARQAKSYKGQAFIFIHGFNVAFDSALFRTAQIAFDIGFDGVPLLYSWPSASSLSEYIYDSNSAQQSVPYLEEFIGIVQSVPEIDKIHLICHSMGSTALSLAIKALSAGVSNKDAFKIAEVIFAAPDVDMDVFSSIAPDLKKVSGGRTLYCSKNDVALKISEAIAGGIPRLGGFNGDTPVLIEGYDTIDISAVDDNYFALKS